MISRESICRVEDRHVAGSHTRSYTALAGLAEGPDCGGEKPAETVEKRLTQELIRNPFFAVRGSRFAVRGSRFAVRGSRFAVRGSRFAVRGSRFAARPG